MQTNSSLPLQEILPLSWTDSRIEVRSSPIHGKGVFAKSNIQKGEVVAIWGGNLFTLEDIRAGKALIHSITAIGEGLFLGHTSEQGYSADDHVNHSCDPNLWLSDGLKVITRRDINTNGELFLDYAMYWGPEEEVLISWECNCGSTLCRKIFTSQDWQRTELHKRYGNHFTPFINEHIRQLPKMKGKSY